MGGEVRNRTLATPPPLYYCVLLQEFLFSPFAPPPARLTYNEVRTFDTGEFHGGGGAHPV